MYLETDIMILEEDLMNVLVKDIILQRIEEESGQYNYINNQIMELLLHETNQEKYLELVKSLKAEHHLDLTRTYYVITRKIHDKWAGCIMALQPEKNADFEGHEMNFRGHICVSLNTLAELDDAMELEIIPQMTKFINTLRASENEISAEPSIEVENFEIIKPILETPKKPESSDLFMLNHMWYYTDSLSWNIMQTYDAINTGIDEIDWIPSASNDDNENKRTWQQRITKLITENKLIVE